KDLDRVVGLYAAIPLVEGTLLTAAQLTAQPLPGPGQQVLGITLDVAHRRTVPRGPAAVSGDRRVEPGARRSARKLSRPHRAGMDSAAACGRHRPRSDPARHR